LYNTATAYGKRPSDFFALETEIGAWALDEACLVIGRKFENSFNEGKNPFTDTLPSPNGSGRYRSAANAKMRRVKIKENGTW
jgi:hypothetical protein